MTWRQWLTAAVRAWWRGLVDEGDEAFEAGEQAFLAEAEAQLAALRRALVEARAQAARSEAEQRAVAGPAAEWAAREHAADAALADRLAGTVAELTARLAGLRRRTAALARREQLRELQQTWRGGAWRSALAEHEDRLARREDRLAACEEWERDSHDTKKA
ncbi:MAG: hypothetical protein KA764_06820 [Anaerolineales bacterium]|nr:hypothetical protein [Anaerolineales bacterium]